jgi:hypothetical protein
VKFSKEIVDKFWSKVDRKSSGCWEWKGVFYQGRRYGRFLVRKGVEYRAHRFSYLLAHGDIPKDLFICHSCDNPCCVNPEHLWAGTHLENEQDKTEKGRRPPPPSVTHPECLARGTRNGAYTKPHRVRKGEQNGTSKLTEWEVRFIRYWYVQGYSNEKLRGVFKVSKATIDRICNGSAWKHV